MIGIKAHRLFDPGDSLFGLSDPGQYLALLHDDDIVVRVQAERTLLVILTLLEALEHQVHRGHDAMRVAVVVVERQCGLDL